MIHKSHTPDERFIICAYQTASALGELSTTLNRYEVGREAGITPKAVNAICRLLIQANFIKKVSEDEIYLTENGERLALRLLEE
jgi:predicted transcriptional regulator